MSKARLSRTLHGRRVGGSHVLDSGRRGGASIPPQHAAVNPAQPVPGVLTWDDVARLAQAPRR